MRNQYFFGALLLLAATATSCSSDADEMLPAEVVSAGTGVSAYDFPQDDGAVYLNGTGAEALWALLKEFDSGNALSLGETRITDAQYAEIKAFTDELVKGCTDDAETYAVIYKWVCNNIRYGNSDNDPYPVFKNRMGVCQGYSNLMKVMLQSQHIPVIVANGYAYGGGHAWNYVFFNDTWRVSDATNKMEFDGGALSAYKFLTPTRADVILFDDDDFSYDFYDGHLNVAEVKQDGEQLTIPFSVKGFRITSFCPHSSLPASTRELYVGANIETFGMGYMSLKDFGKQLTAIYVDESNPKLLGYEGAVYERGMVANYMYYIPGQMETLKLLPMETVEKNTVFDQPNLLTVEFAEGTKTIEAYAVEKCPLLERAIVPMDAVIEENAFCDVAPNFQIVRRDNTGIKNITM